MEGMVKGRRRLLLGLSAAIGLPAAARAGQFYRYDALGRLIAATNSARQLTNYYYDAAGNRTQVAMQAFAGPSGANLPVGAALFPGDALISADGRFGLIFQWQDCNLVLYILATGTALWSSGTSGKPGVFVVMQGDGNLVMYGPQASVIWATYTSGSNTFAVTQTDGNFVIYNGSGAALWNTGTEGH